MASIAIVLSLGIGGVCTGGDDMSASDARRELLERQFKIVTKTKDVPEPVRVLLQALTKSPAQVFAEPGARYQETDVVTEPGLPRRRLIFAGNGKGIYFVCYELGGTGNSQHVAVVEWIPGQVSLVWRAVLNKRVDNLKALREILRQREYKDDLSYAF